MHYSNGTIKQFSSRKHSDIDKGINIGFVIYINIVILSSKYNQSHHNLCNYSQIRGWIKTKSYLSEYIVGDPTEEVAKHLQYFRSYNHVK